MTRFVPVLSLMLLLPSIGFAQSSDSSAADSVFRDAQRLVANGQGDSARAIVQRQLDAATPGSAAYVDALYWHAVVAATASDAERDLRTIIVAYPASNRSADALLRLAQLEMARGETDQAMGHLQRIVVEHPDNPERGRAEFWMARMLLDKNQLPSGCARLADAARLTPTTQVELQNQIGYLQQRCAGVDTSAVAPVAARGAPAPAAPTSSAPPRAASGSSHGSYTVQVAAYSTRAAATRLRDSLIKRGYDARVMGSVRPFRVRVGRYETRAAADSVARRMRARNMQVLVTTAESP